jgi:cytochrome b6
MTKLPATETKAKTTSWLGQRIDLSGVIELLEHKTVPVHSATRWYYFGGITLFLFAIQVITGILLLLYYRPTVAEAFESVRFIMTRVEFGWLIRSIHSWSANLLIFAAFVHMFSVVFTHAYRKPRELTWLSGIVLLGLMLGFGFSGYLLPWNQISYFATKVGTDVAASAPLVGPAMGRFLRGGDDVGAATLTRFFAFHVMILPTDEILPEFLPARTDGLVLRARNPRSVGRCFSLGTG